MRLFKAERERSDDGSQSEWVGVDVPAGDLTPRWLLLFRRVLRIVIVVGWVALAVPFTVLLTSRIVQVVDTPRSTALAYLEAIAAGDADLALSFTDEFDPDAGGRNLGRVDFLSDSVLGNATERITDIEILSLTRSWPQRGSTAKGSIEVRYTLDGVSHTATLQFVKVGSEWRVRSGIGQTLSMNCNWHCDALQVVMSGAEVKIEDGRPTNIALFPAVYRVEATVEPGFRFTDGSSSSTTDMVHSRSRGLTLWYAVEPDQ